MATITEYFEELGYDIFEHNDYVRRSKLFKLVKTMETYERLKSKAYFLPFQWQKFK